MAAKKPMGRPPKPETVLQRAALAAYTGKSKSTVKNKYDAAGNGRRMAGWSAPTQGPNKALTGLQTIRNRARDVSSNDWSGEAAVQKWTTSLIGIGITPRFKRIVDAARKQTITDLYEDFVKKSDADGVLNLYGQQTLVVRSWLDAGEVFIRERPRFLDEGLPVPLQLQVIEAEYVPLLDSDAMQGLPTGNMIRSGIEINKRGRRVAYWMYKQHPGDAQVMNIAADDLVRVAASQICHVFEPKRPGQLRGVSMLAPVLARLKNIENYDDTTLTRQQLANLIVGFITRGTPQLGDDDDTDPLTGQAMTQGGPSGALAPMQPGLLQELDEGQEIKWSNPPEAGTNYPDYMRTQHMGTASAAGIPYELFSGDIINVSDRTLRVIINEFRRFNEQRQWQIIIPMFCQPAIEWFAKAALLAGKIDVSEFDAVCRVEHAPHGWAHIHPVQDPTGKKLEIEAGLRSRSSVVGGYGDDIDKVDQERKDDDAREQRLNIGPYSKSNQQIIAPAVPKAAVLKASMLEVAMADRAQAEKRLFDAHAAKLSAPVPVLGASDLDIAQVELVKAQTRVFNAQEAQLSAPAEPARISELEQAQTDESRARTKLTQLQESKLNAPVLESQSDKLLAATLSMLSPQNEQL